MPIRKRIAGFDGRHSVIVVARVLGGLVLLGAYFLFARDDSRAQPLVAWAIGAWIVWTVVMLVLTLRSNPCPFHRVMTGTVILDSVVFAVLTLAFASQAHDPFYVWYLTEVVVVVLLIRTRWAWMLGWALGTSYVASWIATVGYESAMHNFILVSNVAVFVIVALVVEAALSAEDNRTETLERQRAEALELNARLERSVDELRAVTEITELIHSTLDIDSVGPALLDILDRVVHVPIASLFVIDTTKQETVFTANRGLSGARRSNYSGLELVRAVPVDSGDNALSCVDLLEQKNHLVVLCAEQGVLEALTRDDRIVLQAVAAELIVAVENSRLYRLTTRLAVTDELTNLQNYRFLQQRLDDEIHRAGRYGKPLSFIMLDLDKFKTLNDTYGHLVGDSVLAEMGPVLKSVVREVDVVARYGGEEFSIILPETDASGAFIAAEKVREAISLHRFADAEGEPRIHITASIGLASYPVHARDKESLLRAADDALYRAKTTGRNRVRAPRLRLGHVPIDEASLEEVAE